MHTPLRSTRAAYNPTMPTTILELIEHGAAQLQAAGVAYGHGTTNAFDEAAWLVLWTLQMPPDDLDLVRNKPVSAVDIAQAASIIIARISSRKPAAYLTNEAWLQGVPFYVDERAIVPRSFIAELLTSGAIDPWLSDEHTHRALDLCTGNGSLAVLAAMTYPDVQVTGADLSKDALEVAKINVTRHALQERITLIESDGLQQCGVYDLILCNPPYVNATSMAVLPAEYQAEPVMALASGTDGMDFTRTLLKTAASHMREHAVLVLEIGNERANFEAAFPRLEPIWLETSAGEDQVLLLTREQLEMSRSV